MKELYLDNAATTKPVSSVLGEIKQYMEEEYYNPSSIYSSAKKVRDKIEEVRTAVAREINADTDEIFFTSGATESNNWVIRGFDDANMFNRRFIFTTPIEHKSITDVIEITNYHRNIPIDTNGIVKIEILENMFKNIIGKPKILTSVCMANNEIGTIQNIREIAKIVHKYNGIFHTDATQIFGQLIIDVKDMGIDLMSASAQKLGGLKGIGFLYKKKGVQINPLIYGSQEQGQRGGTENVIGIVSLGEAIKYIYYDKLNLVAIRDKMIDKLIALNCKLNGDKKHRLPNNINVILPEGVAGESMIHMLDVSNIKISSGSACSSNSVKTSHVLKAIGLSEEEAMRTIRITLPNDFNEDDMNYFFEEFERNLKILKA